MVQYSHIPGGLKPKRRVVVSKAIAKCSLSNILKRHNSKRFVAEPIDPESICFTNLPCEIRLMIWHACFESRVVTICAHPRRSWEQFLGYSAAISSVHATMPITLSINRESRYETLRNYPDLIQNPELFRDRVYFNAKLDKLAVHILEDSKTTVGLPQLYHRGRKWRRMAPQCLCHVFDTLSQLAKRSQSMCKMVRFLVSYQATFCRSPNVKECLVFRNISKESSWTIEHHMWKAMTFSGYSKFFVCPPTEIFENDNWQITRTDDYNVIILA
ncbi:hypothetical protein BOTCAL_0667g00060 [Botryotinia calthae]|uniref:2EXR domain-containing protein n=1 Tax=Botryotinia calthae TaxID=38488 RepID=A0A4Y8CJE0_9HELO|nr:hypothetical protein BOTCAL_0667g00060 [Botryotinia calthae]